LAQELGVAQHILRYWETRFPQLRPLQRSGNRRYYRPQDVDIARQIHHLLNVEGFTIKGAVKALSERPAAVAAAPDAQPVATPAPAHTKTAISDEFLARLIRIRASLAEAMGIRNGA
jgi:DNA-binding transcriptional MerR regulator